MRKHIVELKIIRRTVINFTLLCLVGLAPTTTHAKDYSPVFELFEQCVLIKLGNGDAVLREQCEPIFATNYSTNKGQSLEDFNSRWVHSGGKQALTSEPNKYILNGSRESCMICSSTPECEAWKEFGDCGAMLLTGREVFLRDKIKEAITPNFLGFTDVDYVKQELIKSISLDRTLDRDLDTAFVLRLIYSQLSSCYSRTHVNARLLREIASKIQFLRNDDASFAPKHLLTMYRSGIFSPEDSKLCSALDKVVEQNKPKMIEILKKYIKNTPIEKQQCLTVKELIVKYKKFPTNNSKYICNDLYYRNMDRILPIAVDVLNTLKFQQQDKQKTTSEQLIK